jgi:hypothetical protein
MPVLAGLVSMVMCRPLATLAAASLDDPQLDDVRDELDDDDRDDYDDDDGGGGELGEVVAGVVGAVGLLDDIIQGPVTLPAFASHPYAAGHASGLTAPASLRAGDPDAEIEPTPWSGRTPTIAARVALDGAWQYHGLFRGRLAVEIDGGRRIGGALQLYVWGHPGAADHAVLASARLHGVIGNWARVLVRTGPAIDVMHSWTPTTRVTALGADWGLGLDVFVHHPFVLSLDGQFGILGRRTLYAGGRATFGVVIRRVELFGGYEHKQIGRARLGGPLFGLRVWF